MSKHTCGSCRYFQEARLASSGWCHHPLRKVTSDLMIMVRKHEIACRDQWDHDLWEAKLDAGSLAGAPAIADPFPHRKMPPATELEIAAFVAADQSAGGDPLGQSPQRARGDDVVLSELGSTGEPSTYAHRPELVPDWAMTNSGPVEPAATGPATDIGTRNAIIRAREAYRERGRLQAARTAEIAMLAAFANEAVPLNDNLSTAPAGTTAHQDHDAVGRGDPAAMIETGEDHRPALHVRIGSDVQPAGQRSAAAADGIVANRVEVEADPPPSLIEDEAVDHRPVDSQPRAATLDSDPGGTSLSRRQVHADQDTRLQTTDESPPGGAGTFQPDDGSAPTLGTAEFDMRGHFTRTASDHAVEWPSDLDLNAGDRRDDQPYAEFERRGVDYDNTTRDTQLPASRATAADIEDTIDAPDPESNLADETWLTVDVVVEDDSEYSFDLSGLDLLAHLPRVCQNCRDYRPAEAGNRGWCANPWAFSHRRMVAADDEIPCEGTLGHWWLPVDGVWSDAADVSSHGHPTPLLDAWLPHHRDDVAARRRS
ncbi:MAG: hypothetical protein M3464_03460 [Chloroflexota bacterium]|nr:hypothetical protein [Chloroflexota bacterium]